MAPPSPIFKNRTTPLPFMSAARIPRSTSPACFARKAFWNGPRAGRCALNRSKTAPRKSTPPASAANGPQNLRRTHPQQPSAGRGGAPHFEAGDAGFFQCCDRCGKVQRARQQFIQMRRVAEAEYASGFLQFLQFRQRGRRVRAGQQRFGLQNFFFRQSENFRKNLRGLQRAHKRTGKKPRRRDSQRTNSLRHFARLGDSFLRQETVRFFGTVWIGALDGNSMTHEIQVHFASFVPARQATRLDATLARIKTLTAYSRSNSAAPRCAS